MRNGPYALRITYYAYKSHFETTNGISTWIFVIFRCSVGSNKNLCPGTYFLRKGNGNGKRCVLNWYRFRFLISHVDLSDLTEPALNEVKGFQNLSGLVTGNLIPKSVLEGIDS